MTYQQNIANQMHAADSWQNSAPSANPGLPLGVLEDILEDVRRSLAHDPAAAQAAIARLSAILDGKEVVSGVPAYARGGFAPWQRRRIEAFLTENLEHTVRIKALAKMVSLSASHFCRAFKQTFGRTPHDYLTGLRIERAKQLMQSTAEPLSQIALACGLADQAHLCKVFRRCVGRTPSAWRRLYQGA